MPAVIVLLVALLAQKPKPPSVSDPVEGTVRLHMVGRPDLTIVRGVLEDISGVGDVQFTEQENLVSCSFKGKIKELQDIEKRLREARVDASKQYVPVAARKGEKRLYDARVDAWIVSHVMMKFSLTPGTGADSKGLAEEIAQHKAFRKIMHQSASSMEALCDATMMWPNELQAALGDKYGVEIKCTSHEVIVGNVTGKAAKVGALGRELDFIRESMLARVNEQMLTYRILAATGALKDVDIKLAIEKVGLQMASLKRY